MLLNENDRTIALVIAHVDLRSGADILAQFTPDRQLEIIRQIVAFQPDPLSECLAERKCIPFEIIGGIGFVAELLEMFDRATWQAILDGLSCNTPELADKIRRHMFTFEDINKQEDHDIAAILRNVEFTQWALAFKGASEELKSKIFKNMSKRAGKMLQEEIEYLGPQRASDVERVQQEIVDVVRKLEDAGEVTINTGKGGGETFVT
jgi:flagellar motor switch protein FliG